MKLIISLLILGIIPAAAQMDVYINSGVSFPVAPDEFVDYWNLGLDFGGGLGYAISPSISLTSRFRYNTFGAAAPLVVSLSIMSISGNLKLSLIQPNANWAPYASGGIGLFFMSGGNTSETAFSVLASTGIEFSVAKKIDLFIDGNFVIGFTEYEATMELPVEGGVKIHL